MPLNRQAKERVMDSVVVFGLLAIQFIGLALFLIGLPLFVGLMVWDVASDRRHPQSAAVEQIEALRPVAAHRAPRMTA
jgi:hypothetical protein